MATPADLARLHAIAPEPIVTERYPTDALLGAFLDESGSVRRAAGLLWEERVAQTSHYVDIKEGSSSRAMQQEFENAVVLAARYLGHEFMSPERRGARVHTIER